MTDERQTQYLNPREVAGRFLLSKGHVMGDKIDAGIVQDYLEEVLYTVARLRERHGKLLDALKGIARCGHNGTERGRGAAIRYMKELAVAVVAAEAALSATEEQHGR